MVNRLKPILIVISLLLLWQGLVMALAIPAYILPSPGVVIVSLYDHSSLLWEHTLVTLAEMLLGLWIGVVSAILLALLLVYRASLRPWLLPLLLISQAMPTFAIAPMLVLWFGYGLASKVIMTALAIFFPIVTCCYDGLRHTHPGWLDMAQTMGGSRLAILRYIRWPAALPALASGLRVAVVIAPMGAVVGEWVGSSAGLGYMMLQANARLWVDQLFAALAVLAVCAVGLYGVTDRLLRWWLPWRPETARK